MSELIKEYEWKIWKMKMKIEEQRIRSREFDDCICFVTYTTITTMFGIIFALFVV